MLYEKLLSKFYDELKELKRNTSTPLTEAELGKELCAQTISKFKRVVIENDFEDKDSEIEFFKSIKIVPMQYLIYYTEVVSCELRIPKIGQKHQMNFLEKQVIKVNAFFEKHTDFLIYLDSGYNHFDVHYFTRKHLYRMPMVKSYPYYKDPVFNTAYDGILARLRGLALFIIYLKDKMKGLEKINTANGQLRKGGTLKWTGGYAAFVEMVYGCDAMHYFNDGNIEISTIIEKLGDFLNVERGNSSRTYNELKSRKKTQIKFFEETGQKLLERMEKEDALNVRK